MNSKLKELALFLVFPLTFYGCASNNKLASSTPVFQAVSEQASTSSGIFYNTETETVLVSWCYPLNKNTFISFPDFDTEVSFVIKTRVLDGIPLLDKLFWWTKSDPSWKTAVNSKKIIDKNTYSGCAQVTWQVPNVKDLMLQNDEFLIIAKLHQANLRNVKPSPDINLKLKFRTDGKTFTVSSEPYNETK